MKDCKEPLKSKSQEGKQPPGDKKWGKTPNPKASSSPPIAPTPKPPATAAGGDSKKKREREESGVPLTPEDRAKKAQKIFALLKGCYSSGGMTLQEYEGKCEEIRSQYGI